MKDIKKILRKLENFMRTTILKLFSFYPFIFLFLQNHYHELKISPKILYAVILTESKGNPFAVNINCYSKKEALRNYLFLKKRDKHLKIFLHKKYISLYPKDFLEAKNVFYMLKFLKYKSVDLGLMQLNSKVLEKKHIPLKKAYFNVFLNLKIGASILYQCFLKFRNTFNGRINTFECYNKGFDYEKFNGYYFNRVYSNYLFICKKYTKTSSRND